MKMGQIRSGVSKDMEDGPQITPENHLQNKNHEVRCIHDLNVNEAGIPMLVKIS